MRGMHIIGMIGLAACTAFAAGPAALDQTLKLLDQNRTEEAAVLFETVRNTEAGSSTMGKYLSARLDFERGQYTEALQQLAQVMISGERNSEWLPAAVFLEGMIYKKNGQAEAAACAAEELTLGWPESIWSRRAAELK